MAGKQVQIAWEEQDTPEALRERYRRQEEGEVRSRLQALWLLRTGWSMEALLAVAAYCLLAPIGLGIAALASKIRNKPTNQIASKLPPKRHWYAILSGWREQ